MNLMNYYSHNIGDFAAKTRFMSPEEIGIYVILKDEYLRCGMRLACDRIANMMPPGCEASLKRVLDRFFVVEDGFYVCEEFEKELSEYKEKASTNAENAKNGWEKRRKARKSKADLCESHATGMQVGCESHADGCLTNNHKPLTNNQVVSSTPNVNAEVIDGGVAEQDPDVKEGLFNDEPPVPTQRKAVATCPYEKIKALYGEVLPELAQPVMLSSARKSAMKARWQDVFNEEKITTEEEGLNCFRNFFGLVRQSKFLMGRTSKFKATLDWLMKQENFLKVCEGKYRS